MLPRPVPLPPRLLASSNLSPLKSPPPLAAALRRQLKLRITFYNILREIQSLQRWSYCIWILSHLNWLGQNQTTRKRRGFGFFDTTIRERFVLLIWVEHSPYFRQILEICQNVLRRRSESAESDGPTYQSDLQVRIRLFGVEVWLVHFSLGQRQTQHCAIVRMYIINDKKNFFNHSHSEKACCF